MTQDGLFPAPTRVRARDLTPGMRLKHPSGRPWVVEHVLPVAGAVLFSARLGRGGTIASRYADDWLDLG